MRIADGFLQGGIHPESLADCHSRVGGNPVRSADANSAWIPAFAGMTFYANPPPTSPPSFFVITIVAERGRAMPPSGQWLL